MQICINLTLISLIDEYNPVVLEPSADIIIYGQYNRSNWYNQNVSIRIINFPSLKYLI